MVATLDLAGRELSFEEPDTEVFGCLRLARTAGEAGGSAPIALNAANEEAVRAFLAGALSFLGIEAVVEQVLERLGGARVTDLEQVLAVDAEARRLAADAVAAIRRH
jgi:1-deoxy-D-xylulose-5-phosphate reductoisomerase